MLHQVKKHCTHFRFSSFVCTFAQYDVRVFGSDAGENRINNLFGPEVNSLLGGHQMTFGSILCILSTFFLYKNTEIGVVISRSAAATLMKSNQNLLLPNKVLNAFHCMEAINKELDKLGFDIQQHKSIPLTQVQISLGPVPTGYEIVVVTFVYECCGHSSTLTNG